MGSRADKNWPVVMRLSGAAVMYTYVLYVLET